jgi:hypothetical protein
MRLTLPEEPVSGFSMEDFMASSASLTCNFNIVNGPGVDAAVSFESYNGGMNYGGQIVIPTPLINSAVTTSLWDNDGNVCFTIYDINAPVSCTVNSGSNPGSWTPYITVGDSGLTCAVSPPEEIGLNTYNYTLTVNVAPAPPPGPGAPDGAALAAAAPAPQQIAVMTLPPGGREAWTQIMYGNVPAPAELLPGAPIVMAYARFPDGTQVAGGVYKSVDPAQNVKFMWVFDADGNQYPGWPIDVGDEQDFLDTAYIFGLPAGSEPNYQLNVVDTLSQEQAQ